MTDYGSTVGLSPINEDGAGIYRQAFITAGCVLDSSRKWRDAIEDAYANNRYDQLNLSAAVDELRYTVLHLDAAMTPYVVDGRIIDKHDERNSELLAKLGLDKRTDLARQLANVRGGVFGRLGFSGLSAYEVVTELGKATLRAVEELHQRKEAGGDIDCLLGPESVLRTEILGLGLISRADIKSLEKECLWEAEQAWKKAEDKAVSQPQLSDLRERIDRIDRAVSESVPKSLLDEKPSAHSPAGNSKSIAGAAADEEGVADGRDATEEKGDDDGDGQQPDMDTSGIGGREQRCSREQSEAIFGGLPG